MSEKPEALRLADELDAYHNAPHHKLAAIELRCHHYELRRLHAENERLREALDNLISACELPGDHCEVAQALPHAKAALRREGTNVHG